jgi:hypothetical protein
MDINRIFNLFNNDDFTPHTKKELEELKKFDEFKDTPPYKVGMFEKMILNHSNVRKQVISLFKKSNGEFNVRDIEEAGEFMAYNRAWGWISECDLDDDCWKESLILRNGDYLTTAVKLAVHYFEGYEEYEKCAFLKKIETFLEESLAPKD